jgi:DNA-binding response OmpR family regulator
MPEVNGLEFCKTLKEYKNYREIPFIIISGLVDFEFKSKLLEAGASEAIPKGFKDKQLKKIVERYYRQKMVGNDYAVLLVDDSKFNRKIVSDMLRELKFKLYEAEDPIQAEEIIKDHAIDLILLDNEMPHKTGVQWCKELRASEEYENISIISVSATKDISLTFLKAGANDFIHKPFTKEEVMVKVKQQLRRVDLERELKNHIEKEKALNHQKNILLGTAAHDIRNPIAAVISFLSLIQENKYDDEDTNFVIDNCYSSAESALELLNEILDVSNISSGVLKLDYNNCFFTSLVADHVDAQNMIAKKKQIGISIETDIPDDLQVKLDAKRIGQVFDNLLSNAIKYSHPEVAPFSWSKI